MPITSTSIQVHKYIRYMLAFVVLSSIPVTVDQYVYWFMDITEFPDVTDNAEAIIWTLVLCCHTVFIGLLIVWCFRKHKYDLDE